MCARQPTCVCVAVAASNIPNMYREGCYDMATHAAVGAGLASLSEEQAFLANSVLEVMIQNGACGGVCVCVCVRQ